MAMVGALTVIHKGFDLRGSAAFEMVFISFLILNILKNDYMLLELCGWFCLCLATICLLLLLRSSEILSWFFGCSFPSIFCVLMIWYIGILAIPAIWYIGIGPSGVHALPLGVAAKRSVHYIWYCFSFFFCATYFSPRRVYRRVPKFCMGFLSDQQK